MGYVGALKDGKDFETDTPHKHEKIARCMWSDKIHNSGVQIISWITPMGLNFKHKPMYMARMTDNRLIELWGEILKKRQVTKIYKKEEHLDLPQDRHM